MFNLHVFKIGKATDKNSFSADSVRRRMQEQFEANAARPLFTGVAVRSFFLQNILQLSYCT